MSPRVPGMVVVISGWPRLQLDHACQCAFITQTQHQTQNSHPFAQIVSPHYPSSFPLVMADNGGGGDDMEQF